MFSPPLLSKSIVELTESGRAITWFRRILLRLKGKQFGASILAVENRSTLSEASNLFSNYDCIGIASCYFRDVTVYVVVAYVGEEVLVPECLYFSLLVEQYQVVAYSPRRCHEGTDFGCWFSVRTLNESRDLYETLLPRGYSFGSEVDSYVIFTLDNRMQLD